MLIEIPSALLKLPCHHFSLQSHLAGGLMPFELHSRQRLQRHREIMAETKPNLQDSQPRYVLEI